MFAGNTSTGVLGTQNTRGHVYTGGLSLLHDFRPSLTLGGEIYGGYTTNGDLGRTQFQAMAGGQYAIRKGLSFCFGLLGGKYVASPRVGGQIGFALDFPDFFDRSPSTVPCNSLFTMIAYNLFLLSHWRPNGM